MEHSKITLKLSAFVDKEVPETLKAEIDAHLKSCPECSAEVEKLISQRVYLLKAGEILPSDNLRAKIDQKLEAKKSRDFGFNIGKLIPIPVTLSILILLFSAFMITSPLIYGSNDDTLKVSASDMVKNAAFACFTGSVFSPAAFMKMCNVTASNACACCGGDLKHECKMGGCKHGN